MADISLIQDDSLDDSDEGVFEQGDGPSGGQVDDDILPPLARIQKHAFSENAYDRQFVPQILLELFRTGPIDLLETDLPQIMNIVLKLGDDDEIMVRTDLIEQIPNIVVTAMECSGRVPKLNNIFDDYLLTLILRNLGADDNQVRKAAQLTLFTLMDKGLITKQQAELEVCPTVLDLSNMENLIDCHTGTVTLMSRLAPFLGKEVTEKMFLQKFSQLCFNQMFYVRKVCASHFGDFCAVIGKEAYEHILLPCYLALCSDEIWGVRKACAEVVMSVSYACPAQKRHSALAPVFARLLQDQSRWVRMSAFQALGPFITTFADPTITSLSYNNSGELVFINNDGRQFRISPTYTDTNILRSVGELQMLYQFQERSKGMEEEQQNYPEKGDDDDVIFNPLMDLENEEETKIDNLLYQLISPKQPSDLDKQEPEEETEAEVGAEVEIDAKVEPEPESKEQNEEIPLVQSDEEYAQELQANNVIIENFFKAINVLCSPNNEKEDETLPKGTSEGINELCPSSNQKEEDSTVVNEITTESTNDFNEIECNSCDNRNSSSYDLDDLTERITCLDIVNNDNYLCNGKSEVSDINSEINVNNENCTENIEEFNSFNYWYVSPDMPLDPDIVTGENEYTFNSMYQASPVNTNGWSNYPTMDKFPMYIEHHLNSSANCSYPEPKPPTSPPSYENNDKPIQHIVPQLLIDHFVSMSDPNLALNTDNEIAYHCAYSLPAVALTLGSKNWYLLKDTVENLAANMQYKVRRTVASSLHELAMILGPDIATNYLTPIFEGFIKDLDEVRIGVLKHLADFLKLISPHKRNMCLPRLAEFLQMDNQANWRFRQELAEQLLMAVPLFRPSDSIKHISTIAQELLCDKVAAVREVALLLISVLIGHISTDPTLTSRLLVKLAEKFAHSKRWKLRQTFALLCAELLTSKALPPEQFANEVMPHLLDLSWDPVPNVRLVVARTISRHIVTNEYFANVSNQHYDGLQTVLRRLQSDKDHDVRQSAIIYKTTSVE